jgi:beta-glucosidase
VTDVAPVAKGDSLDISFNIANTGAFDGAEVLQVYLSGKNCDVVMPMKELKAYKRVTLNKGEAADETITLDAEAFSYFDQDLKFGMHNGVYTVMLGNASDNILHTFEVKVRGGKVEIA